ncbi:MAG: hypothetical protein IT580_17815 [Verrucomicrobiales bacterium]|nr:hypothetical protein [Verrucomicrobiales bacterium]
MALRLYPAAYRERFGEEMEQVFRAQLRAAVARSAGSGVAWVMMRSMADLVVTACHERWAAMSERRIMKCSSVPWSRSVWTVGMGLLGAVLVLGVTIATTLLMTPAYRSTAHVRVDFEGGPAGLPGSTVYDPYLLRTEAEVVAAYDSLARVAEQLSLASQWSAKYLRQGTLVTPEVVPLLRDRVEVVPLRNTMILEVRAWDADPQTAAAIANALAEEYVSQRRAGRTAAVLIDRAEPGLRPMRPNVPLNVSTGFVLACGFGLGVASLTWLATGWMRGRGRGPGPMRASAG